MDLYTVLLVDDEESIMKAIKRKINWEGLGFSVIGYADNGVKALELVEEYQPDVVVSDIKMPYMDGIEMADRIKKEYPMTKILFFTGFDEFEYAKEAVHLKVEEYILKPASAVELTNVFSQLKEKMDQEINEKKNAEILQKYYLESLPLMQSNFYITLIEGRIDKKELSKYLSDYQLSFMGPFFCCAVIHVSSSQMPEDMNIRPLLLKTLVNKQFEEQLKDKWKIKSFTYLDNTVLIAELSNENKISEFTNDCDQFCRYAFRITGALVTIGIGPVTDNVLQLFQSYESAREAVSYRAIYGASQAINMQEIAPRKMIKGDTGNTGLLNLFKAVRLGGREDIISEAEKFSGHMEFESLGQHDIMVMELISSIYRFAASNDIDGFWEDTRKVYWEIVNLDPDSLREWLIDISISLSEKIVNERSMSTKSFVWKAKEYVHNNFSDEGLSLNTVCEILGVSNSYFSTIFKKETGNSFIAYLTDYRLDKASHLLIETNEKSYIIGNQVGYADPNYFSYAFKRKFGVSPTKYRTEHMESEKKI